MCVIAHLRVLNLCKCAPFLATYSRCGATHGAILSRESQRAIRTDANMLRGLRVFLSLCTHLLTYTYIPVYILSYTYIPYILERGVKTVSIYTHSLPTSRTQAQSPLLKFHILLVLNGAF